MMSKRQNKWMLGAWYESATPAEVSDEELALWLDGDLGEPEREELAARLATSPEALEVLAVCAGIRDMGEGGLEDPSPAVVRRALRAMPDKRPVAQRVLDVVLEFASDCINIVQSSADDMRFYNFARQEVRGPAGAVPGNLVLFRKTFEGMAAEVEIERIADNRSEVSVRATGDGGATPSGVLRINLYRNETLTESQRAVGGRVVFEDLPYGDYEITLEQDESEVGRIKLSMRGEAA